MNLPAGRQAIKEASLDLFIFCSLFSMVFMGSQARLWLPFYQEKGKSLSGHELLKSPLLQPFPALCRGGIF
jgi:hypothetical protein